MVSVVETLNSGNISYRAQRGSRPIIVRLSSEVSEQGYIFIECHVTHVLPICFRISPFPIFDFFVSHSSFPKFESR